MKEFANLFPVSKTLRFELQPIGKTKENIEKNGILQRDEKRAEDYKIVKGFIDEYHKQFIKDRLWSFKLPLHSEGHLDSLEEYQELYELSKRNDAQEAEFTEVKDNLRSIIAKRLTESGTKYDTIFKKELIREDLIDSLENNEDKDIVRQFADFTTYFSGFHENRRNMYVADETGGIDFYNIGENYAAGTLLNGYITAKYTVYKGTKELTEPTEKNIEATDGTVNATPLEGESVSLDANEYTLVQVTGELTKTDNNYFIDGLQVYNKFKISEIDLGSLTEGNTYIATGIVVPYNNNAELALTAIEEVATSINFTIAEACTDGKGNYFGTFYTDKAYVMPVGVTGQTVAVDANSKLVVNDAYDAGSVVPAKTPLLMKATAAGEKTAEVTTEEGSAATNNMLKGTLTADEETTGGDKYYRLTMHNGTTLGFYWGAENGGAFKPGANKAYLAVPAAAAKEGFAFGETTGINNVNANENESGKIFNLAGQQMKSAVKGVYIKNGRKYVK